MADQKYKALERRIKEASSEEEINELCRSFEYLAISLIQRSSLKVLTNIMNDIGLWFKSHCD
ncbi:MAG: hypothetical protein IJ757_07030 [Clostridiales bacterium]|nr:hypothetical protein [Clostridiales bacterium]